MGPRFREDDTGCVCTDLRQLKLIREPPAGSGDVATLHPQYVSDATPPFERLVEQAGDVRASPFEMPRLRPTGYGAAPQGEEKSSKRGDDQRRGGAHLNRTTR